MKPQQMLNGREIHKMKNSGKEVVKRGSKSGNCKEERHVYTPKSEYSIKVQVDRTPSSQACFLLFYTKALI
jgi:hypothetical protein